MNGTPSKMIAALQGLGYALSQRVEATVDRVDAWKNEYTGMGTGIDKTAAGYIIPDRWLTDPEISALYHHDDMAARMVDVVPQEMLRKGFAVELGTAEATEAAARKHDQLDTRGVFEDGVRWGRCYGAGAVLIGCDDRQDAANPLAPERADDVGYLLALDRRLLWPFRRYNERGTPKYGKVETYLVTSGEMNAEYVEVHESRLIIFPGATTGIRERQLLLGWDASVLQRAFDTLRQFNTGWKAVETMMTDGNQTVFKMGALTEILRAPGGGSELLRRRLQAIEMYRSFLRAIVLDADANESFERQTVSFDSIPQTLDKFMLRLAATVEVPVTILMGQSPAGMNATGDSDFRWFYDRIESKQNAILTPRVRRLTNVWLRTRAGQEVTSKLKAGTDTERLSVKYAALWTETPLVQAQRRSALITGDVALIKSEQMSPAEVAAQRLRPGGYDRELVLDDKGEAVRQSTIAQEYEAQAAAVEVDDAAVDEEAAKMETNGAAPADDAPIPGSSISLAPTDLASILTVDEGRASAGYPPLANGLGKISIVAYKAKQATLIADVAAAELGQDPNEPRPAQPLAFGGGGGGPPVKPGPDGEEQSPPEPSPEADPEEPQQPKQSEDDEELFSFDAVGQRQAVLAMPRPRTFTLQRDEDESGVSGTGAVAYGTLWPNGKATVCWNTATSSITQFDDIEHVERVHGHGGKTRIVWHDERGDALPIGAWLRLDAAAKDMNALQDKEAKKAAKAAKEKSKAAWAKTHEAQQAAKAAKSDPSKADHAKSTAKAAAAAHAEAKGAWEHTMNTARPGSGQFLAASAVVQDHASQQSKAESAASGGGWSDDLHPRDEAGKFA